MATMQAKSCFPRAINRLYPAFLFESYNSYLGQRCSLPGRKQARESFPGSKPLL